MTPRQRFVSKSFTTDGYSSSTGSLAKKTSDQIVKTVTDHNARARWRMQ
jgi:hypothetical protein